MAGQCGDDFFTVVGGAFPHDGAEDLDEFVGLVVGHADGTGTDKGGAVGLDDPAADGGSEVASEGFVDLGAEALVAEDEGDFLEKLVTIEPALATGGLAERCHDVVGVDLVDRRRAGRRFGGREVVELGGRLGLLWARCLSGGRGSSPELSGGSGSSSSSPNLRLGVLVDALDFGPGRLDAGLALPFLSWRPCLTSSA